MTKKQQLIWQDGVPVSKKFGDVYFSKDGGLEETRHVFLAGNGLPQRWIGNKEGFTIIETGFGTGLNFFTTLKAWREKSRPEARLNYISIEKYPLEGADIEKTMQNWPELMPFFDKFGEKYPADPSGMCDLSLEGGRVRLCLIFSDVKDALPSIKTKADAWFLDGFAPAKNPDMWGKPLYENMRRLTRKGGTFSTFTAASAVRRGLEENGFAVEKVAGFGKKREMLRGVMG